MESMERLVVVLDFANINAPLSRLMLQSGNGDNRHEEFYGRMLHYLAEGRFLIDAFAYVPIDPRNEYCMRQTIDRLWQSGFFVTTKIGTIAGDTYKCNFDVEIAIDVMRIAHTVRPDIFVIASGDGDFLPVVRELRKMGIRAEVASFDQCVSQTLAGQCSGYISLDTFFDEWQAESIAARPDIEDAYDGATDSGAMELEAGEPAAPEFERQFISWQGEEHENEKHKDQC